jgi:glutathione S-transferase
MTFEEDGLILFESGAIVLHIAERCERLFPSELKRRARAQVWMFAALNTVEPPVVFLNQLQQMEVSEARALQKPVMAVVQWRLRSLADSLESCDYLEKEFSAADLLMTTVLRILRTTDLVPGPSRPLVLSQCGASAIRSAGAGRS